MRLFAGSRAATFVAAFAVIAIGLPLHAQEKVDVATIERIKSEALERSQVMDIMSWLTDVHGPRLSWSPNMKKAANWTVETMKSWGLSNVHLETWDTPAGIGWANERFSFNATSPNPFIVDAVPRAWSAGTNGRVSGAAVRVQVDCFAELQQKYAGKLRNAFILPTGAPTNPVTEFNSYASRRTDSSLATMAAATLPPAGGAGGGRAGGGRAGGGRAGDAAPPAMSPVCQQAAAAAAAANAGGRGGRGGGGGRGGLNTGDTTTLRWMQREGVAAILMGGRGGANSVGGDIATDNGASRARGAPQVPFVHVATESYGRIARMLERNVPVTLELDMQNKFYPENTSEANVVGEIPGTDPALKDEVVMIGGHFDSWHSGTGATDNAAGSGVMLEAMRILKKLNLQPRRTIRIALWTGEEQGLLGSRAYVRQHFGYTDSTGQHFTPEQAKFAAYFNLDNGTGKIRGVYAQSNPAVAPIFDAWMGPFKSMGMSTNTIGNTGGTDHLSFDAVNLPGFQFIQDPLDYSSRTHHTNQDVYERIQPDDMKFNAAVLAAFAWQAAQRDQKLPRKPLAGAQ
ncbi:MAG TPA: M20/M25/M40 family metallo-hydrolase [Gemmatimonadaceae bacterium]|nr:M20/M25/M40 family metallo-hydrolase [Gemmatimonadaceae bacterium]